MWRNTQTAARRQHNPPPEPSETAVPVALPVAETPQPPPRPDPPAPPTPPTRDKTSLGGSLAWPRRRHISLTWRILAVNVLALVTLVVGLLYLDRYRASLIDAELDSLAVQAQIFAEAIGESAVLTTQSEGQDYLTASTRPLVRRLAESANLRARLFAINGDLIADSRALSGPGGMVQIAELPPPEPEPEVFDPMLDAYEWALGLLPGRADYPPYRESAPQVATDYPEAVRA